VASWRNGLDSLSMCCRRASDCNQSGRLAADSLQMRKRVIIGSLSGCKMLDAALAKGVSTPHIRPRVATQRTAF
jgi:hypothetical protein